MNTAHAHQVKSAFAFALVASVVLGALTAILGILGGPMALMDKFALNCVIIAAASACGLACASLAVRGGRALSSAGIVLALAAAVLLTGGIWADRVPDEYWQTACSVSIFAIACGHLAALSLARLAPWHRWSLALAYVLVIGIASVYVLSILGCSFTLWVWQLVSVMMTLNVAVTILIPYFHWRSRDFVALEAFARLGETPGQRPSARAARAARREPIGDDDADDRFFDAQVGVRNQLNHGIRPVRSPSRRAQW